MVKTTTPFGAFVEIMPGTEGLVHISEMRHERTEKTEDVVKKGDRVKVKLIDRDERGRLRLSMKALIPKPDGTMPEAEATRGNGSEGSGSGEPEGSSGGSGGERPRRTGPRRGTRGGGDRGRSRE